MLVLVLILTLVSSCSLTKKKVYVPAGKAVEVRKPTLIPIWVRDEEDGKRKAAWVVAGERWLLGPPDNYEISEVR